MMKSLYVKFALSTVAIMIVSSIIAFMASNFYYQQKLKPENDEKITIMANEVVQYIESEQTDDMLAYLNSIAALGYQIALITEDNEKSYFGDGFRNETLSTEVIHTVLEGQTYHGIAEFPQGTFVTGFFANELKNTIGVPLTYENENYALFMRPNIKVLFSEMHMLLTALLIVTISLSIIFVLVNIKFFVRPITDLTLATKKLATGNFSVNVKSDRADELGELTRSFNRMATQLQESDDIKNEFISNVSHDIQSPLSNIKGYTQLLENDSINKADKQHYLSVIYKEVDRLSGLTKQLLLLTSLQHDGDLVNKQKYSLSEQLENIILNYKWELEKHSIMMSYTLGNTIIEADESLLHNAWENLLTNAIKYNVENGKINIQIYEDKKHIYVRFKDSGIGIKNENIERLFDRFYRVESSRTNTIQGSGLGLSIVQTIVHMHQGHVDVESKMNEGTTITVTLPK